MISKDMLITDIVDIDRDLAGILMRSGMHCLGCAMAHMENLEQACQVHGIDADVLVKELNEFEEAKNK